MSLPMALLLISCDAARGQTAPLPAPLPSPIPAQDTIRLDTSLVVIDARIVDRRTGQFVSGLKSDDFILSDDGVRQEITHFSQDSLNLSVILLLDLSGSVSPVLHEIRSGALGALSRLRKTDEVAVMAFSSNTRLVQEFTRDRGLIIDRIREIEKTPVIGQGTSLFQAISDAATHMELAGRNRSNRRVIITITDNVAWDYNFSGLTAQEVSRRVIDSDSMVCGLIVEGTLNRAEKIFLRNRAGQDIYRRRMTIDPFIDLSGGEMIRANPGVISSQLATLVDHLRSRYSFGYTPKRESDDDRYHQIALRLSDEARRRFGDLLIRTRQGYRIASKGKVK